MALVDLRHWGREKSTCRLDLPRSVHLGGLGPLLGQLMWLGAIFHFGWINIPIINSPLPKLWEVISIWEYIAKKWHVTWTGLLAHYCVFNDSSFPLRFVLGRLFNRARTTIWGQMTSLTEVTRCFSSWPHMSTSWWWVSNLVMGLEFDVAPSMLLVHPCGFSLEVPITWLTKKGPNCPQSGHLSL